MCIYKFRTDAKIICTRRPHAKNDFAYTRETAMAVERIKLQRFFYLHDHQDLKHEAIWTKIPGFLQEDRTPRVFHVGDRNPPRVGSVKAYKFNIGWKFI